jgi:hypothetical protein
MFQCLCSPAEAYACTHSVKAIFFNFFDYGENFIRSFYAEECTQREYKFKIIGNADRFKLVTLIEFTAIHTDMNTSHRAACA